MDQHIGFLLVPDSGFARRLRRVLATEHARLGVMVGTIGELIEYAREVYLLPEPTCLNREQLHASLGEITDAFWSQSYSVSPDDTAVAVEVVLVDLLTALGPGQALSCPGGSGLSARVERHLGDLTRLVDALEGTLPRQLATIDALLSSSGAPIRRIVVYPADALLILSRWDMALINKLNGDAARGLDSELADILHSLAATEPKASPSTALETLQKSLFSAPAQRHPVDDSLQFVGVRDFLQEAEVAAGMVQQLLKKDPSLTAADIALLIPDSYEYAVALESAFSSTGMVLSGLPQETWRRDLGREALYHFLYCLQKPSPAMALVVCLSSPLMPWSREEGGNLAQAVMDGDYSLRTPKNFAKNGNDMLTLIREGAESNIEVIHAIESFVALLGGTPELKTHREQAKEAGLLLVNQLQSIRTVDWGELRRLVTPRIITEGDETVFIREGVTIWREGREPWRPARHAIVLGFAEGQYPHSVPRSPVFTPAEWQEIHDKLGIPVETPGEKMHQRRLRFKRQLAEIRETVTILIPRKSPSGEPQSPSDSYIFMQQLFTEGAARIKELDVAEDRKTICHLAVTEEGIVTPPRELITEDLALGRDLLALRRDKDGNQSPESPSNLETLMVSPLAWLLRRLDAEPIGWAPEKPNVKMLGILSHQVFEDLFPVGAELLDRAFIEARIGTFLDQAILRCAPYLRGVQWHVERKNLEAGIREAALVWRDILEALQAEVIGNEIWLEGKLGEIPIHGQADQLISLPGNRHLVVDYKRQSSGDRRDRMNAGFDSQASLYRTMLETGGPKSEEDDAIKERLKKSTQTGIVYYMMNDQRALADLAVAGAGSIPGWESISGNVAEQAIALIEQRLADVKEGKVCLNRTSDAEFFDKTAKVKPYALKNSPLITLFTKPDTAEEAL